MKVLHVIPYVHPSFGGPVTALNSIIESCNENGIDSDILSTSAGFCGGQIERNNNYFIQVNDRYIFNLDFPKFWFYSSMMNEWIEKNIVRYDLVHLHVPFTAPFFMASKAALRYGIPTIVTPHGLLDPWSMSQKKLKKIPYYYFIERKNLRSAKIIHATSKFEANRIENLGLGVHVATIPLSVPYLNVRKKNTIINNVINLLFIGRIHPVKSIPAILDALVLIKKCGISPKLNLAGSGGESYIQYLKKKIQDNNLEADVIWHGHVNDVEKLSLYEMADIFLMPSQHENFGLAAAEAMSAGVPVIVSDQVGLAADIAKYGGGLIVNVNNSSEIAGAIKLIYDQQSSLKMGAVAKELTRKYYSSYIFTQKIKSMYKFILKDEKNKS